MRKFNKIDIGIRKDVLQNVLLGTSRYIKIPVLSIECKNEQLIREILTGIHQIRFDCFENKDGSLNFSENKDHKYLSAISNFYFNEYSVDGVYFEDLSPLERHIFFESLEVNAITLRLPFTNEDLLNFQSRIR